MVDIKITRASVLKEKPASSTLVFGKSMTDDMFIVDYDEARAGTIPASFLTAPCRLTPPPRSCTMRRRSSRA